MGDPQLLDETARHRGPRSAPPRRRGLWYVGIALILVGLSVLGYVAWQFFGTNVVSRHEASEIRKETKASWTQGRPGPAQALLHVPRFGRDYSVPIVQGLSDDALARGVGRYPEGAKAGGLGNFVLAGHRVTHGQPFRDFPELRKGDLVEVETRTATYTYRLRDGGRDVVVDFTTAWPLWPVPSPDAANKAPRQHLITLLTCSEIFHTDNRSVVVGDLVKTHLVSR